MRELSPDVSLELDVSFLTHCALYNTLDDCVTLIEDLIVKQDGRLEVSDLCVLIKGIYKDEIDPVLGYVSCHITSSCCKVSKVRAAFYSEPLWIKANILKLVKMNKANQEVSLQQGINNSVNSMMSVSSKRRHHKALGEFRDFSESGPVVYVLIYDHRFT